MRSIVLVIPESKEFQDFLMLLDKAKYEKFNAKANEIYIEGSGGGFVDLSKCNSLADSFDDEELDKIGRIKADLDFYQVNFDDIELLKEILITAFSVDDIYIDDDFNDIVSGKVFKEIVLKNPGWDWREWELQGRSVVT
jgi:hypothetical protein